MTPRRLRGLVFLPVFVVLLAAGCGGKKSEGKDDSAEAGKTPGQSREDRSPDPAPGQPRPDGNQPAKPKEQGQEAEYKGKPLNAWLEQLNTRDADQQQKAADVLKNLGPEEVPAGVAVPLLSRALQNRDIVRDYGQRDTIRQALRAYGPDAFSALAEGLQSREWQERQAAAEALGELIEGMGARGKPALAPLEGVIRKDRVREVRQAAVTALGKLGADAVPALGEALRADVESAVRQTAATALEKLGAAAVPALVEAMKSESEGVRLMAVDTVGRIGQAGKKAGPALAGLLIEESPSMRKAVVAALYRVGIDSREMVAPLVAGLKVRDEHRVHLIARISWLGPEAKEAAPALIALLKDRDDEAVVAAASTLRTIGEGRKEATVALAGLLEARSEITRQQAAGGLGAYGPSAKEHVAPLVRVLKDVTAQPATRSAAATALGHIGPDAKEAVPALETAAKDKDIERVAQWALAKIQR